MRRDTETLTEEQTPAIRSVVFIIESPEDGVQGVQTVGAVIGSLPSPGQSARRSRRGYYYQDLVSLGFCIDMLSGEWDHVTPDGDEDVVCVAADPAKVTYVQVKTEESAGQHWTVSKCTRPDIVGRPETSVLGRLFVGKPLPDESTFILLTNEGVSDSSRPLTVVDRGSTADELLRKLEQRLTPLDLGGEGQFDGALRGSWCSNARHQLTAWKIECS